MKYSETKAASGTKSQGAGSEGVRKRTEEKGNWWSHFTLPTLGPSPSYL